MSNEKILLKMVDSGHSARSIGQICTRKSWISFSSLRFEKAETNDELSNERFEITLIILLLVSWMLPKLPKLLRGI